MRMKQGYAAADYIAQIPVHILVEQGIKVVGLYLKYYNKSYWDAVEAAGIVIVPIFELSPGRALQGAPAGHIDGKNGAIKSLSFGQSPSKGIIYTHDTSEHNSVVDDYFGAVWDELKIRGYSFENGYWAKNVADAVRAFGVPVHLNWAPAAWAWDGGIDPLAQIRQKPSSVVPGFPARWDRGTVWIDVDLYHPWDAIAVPPSPVIPPYVPGKKASKMFTNEEILTLTDIAAMQQRPGLDPGQIGPEHMQARRIYWRMTDDEDTKVIHIKKTSEVQARGGESAAIGLTTKLLLELVDPV